ncbi:hypothetical protein AAD001_18485 [Colwelliaceae bacterium 6471]
MKFSLPAQLKGPECKNVMLQAISIRKKLEPVFFNIEFDSVNEISIILRVDGSLGSFGMEGIENFELTNGICTCDVVIRDLNWVKQQEEQISKILKLKILEAIVYCFKNLNFNTDISKIKKVLS